MFKAFDISSWTFNNLNVSLGMFLHNKKLQTKRLHSIQLQLLALFHLAPGFLQPPNAFSRNTATSSVKWSCSFPAPTCTPRGRPSSPRPRGHWVTGSPRMLMIPGEGMKWLNMRPKQTSSMFIWLHRVWTWLKWLVLCVNAGNDLYMRSRKVWRVGGGAWAPLGGKLGKEKCRPSPATSLYPSAASLSAGWRSWRVWRDWMSQTAPDLEVTHTHTHALIFRVHKKYKLIFGLM